MILFALDLFWFSIYNCILYYVVCFYYVFITTFTSYSPFHSVHKRTTTSISPTYSHRFTNKSLSSLVFCFHRLATMLPKQLFLQRHATYHTHQQNHTKLAHTHSYNHIADDDESSTAFCQHLANVNKSNKHRPVFVSNR